VPKGPNKPEAPIAMRKDRPHSHWRGYRRTPDDGKAAQTLGNKVGGGSRPRGRVSGKYRPLVSCFRRGQRTDVGRKVI